MLCRWRYSLQRSSVPTLQRVMKILCKFCPFTHLFSVLTVQQREFDGTVPSHFYGEMSKTELGCQVLHEKGHFSEFSDFIRQHGLECGDPELILKLKSILWAVVSLLLV